MHAERINNKIKIYISSHFDYFFGLLRLGWNRIINIDISWGLQRRFLSIFKRPYINKRLGEGVKVRMLLLREEGLGHPPYVFQTQIG